MLIPKNELRSLRRQVKKLTGRVRRLEQLIATEPERTVSSLTTASADKDAYSLSDVMDEYLNGKKEAADG